MLAIAFLLWLACPEGVVALSPPREIWHDLGTDSAGGSWRALLSHDQPLKVAGPKQYEVKTKEPLDIFEIHPFIDASDTAWIVDGRGRGVKLKLASGAVEEFRVPIAGQLLGGIVVANGAIYFGEGGGPEGRSVRRWGLASARTETLVPLTGDRSIERVFSGRKHIWLLALERTAKPRHGAELIALDPASGQVLRRSRRELATAESRQWKVEVLESADGAVWLANGYSGRVERFDGEKAWESWELAGRQPSNLVPARFGAACLLERTKVDERPELRFMGPPPVTLLQREIAVFQPGKTRFLTLNRPVDQSSQLSRDVSGEVLVDGQAKLILEGGELRIVPSRSRGGND